MGESQKPKADAIDHRYGGREDQQEREPGQKSENQLSQIMAGQASSSSDRKPQVQEISTHGDRNTNNI